MTDQARKRPLFAVLHLLQPRNLAVFGFDVAMAFCAMLAAYGLRLFEFLSWDFFTRRPEALETAVFFALVAAGVYLVTGIYRHMWEYVSAKDAFNILRTATLVVAIFVPLWFWLTRLEGVPRSVPVIAYFVLVAFLSGPRLLFRISRDGQMRGLMRRAPTGTPVLLIGAGAEAEHFIRAASRSPDANVRVVGMVAAADGVGADRIGQVIHGVEILGREADIVRVVNGLARRGLAPEKLVLVTPTHDGTEVQRLLATAEDVGCQLSRVPPPTDLQAYDTTDLKPRPIAIEDLLGRPQARLDRVAMTTMINARRVLITGAGGSIGSELVRQISDAVNSISIPSTWKSVSGIRRCRAPPFSPTCAMPNASAIFSTANVPILSSTPRHSSMYRWWKPIPSKACSPTPSAHATSPKPASASGSRPW